MKLKKLMKAIFGIVTLSTAVSLAIFYQKSTGFSTFQQTLNLLLASTLTLASLITFIFLSKKHTKRQRILWSSVTTTIFLSSLIILWNLIQEDISAKRTSQTIITNTVVLDQLKEHIKERARDQGLPEPIFLPTGIFISNLTLPGTNRTKFFGYAWQKYPLNLPKNEQKGINLPEASDISYDLVMDHSDHTYETQTWTIKATLPQQYVSWEFPLDETQISILFEPKTILSETVVIPDIDGYNSIQPESTPGLYNKVMIPGFTIRESFFDMGTLEFDSNLGMSDFSKISKIPTMRYNIFLSRNLVDILVLYLLPLLVILCVMFVIFIISTVLNNLYQTLTPYTALLFSLIILHNNLRSKVPAGKFLYIEYFICLAYLTLICLILYRLAEALSPLVKKYQMHLYYLIATLFWPVHAALWFFMTFIAFY